MDQTTADMIDGITVILTALIKVVGFDKVVAAIPQEDVAVLLASLLTKYL